MRIGLVGEVLLEFAAMLEELGLEKLVFKPGVSREELEVFLDIIAEDVDEAAESEVGDRIEKSGIRNIEAGTIEVSAEGLLDPATLFRTWESYSAGLQMMRGIRAMARETGEIHNVDEIRRLAFDLTSIAMQESRPLLAVHALMKHDEYSFTHSLNVAMLTLALAQNLPFRPEDLHEITLAALLHDIGKERIPGDILRKPGRLTPEEFEIMNTHGLEGARMLSNADGIGDLAPLVAYEHHLAYHEDLRDDDWEPHLVSQLVSIADVYDALRSIRPYRGEVPPDETLRIMEKDTGTKFEPSLFAGFKAMVGYFPPGTALRLDSGKLAVSFATNPHTPDLPQVMVVREPDGTELDPAVPVNLASPEAHDSVDTVISATEEGIDPVAYL